MRAAFPSIIILNLLVATIAAQQVVPGMSATAAPCGSPSVPCAFIIIMFSSVGAAANRTMPAPTPSGDCTIYYTLYQPIVCKMQSSSNMPSATATPVTAATAVMSAVTLFPSHLCMSNNSTSSSQYARCARRHRCRSHFSLPLASATFSQRSLAIQRYRARSCSPATIQTAHRY
jgi:hypothetical protein